MKKILTIVFGFIFTASLLILLCDITVFGALGFRLLPDYVILLVLIETVCAFAFIALKNFKYIPKIVPCICQMCFLIICVFVADLNEYRYTDIDGVETIEICNGVTMAGPTVSYHYEVDGFVRSCEKYACSDYGVLQCEEEMIFTNTPQKVVVYNSD